MLAFNRNRDGPEMTEKAIQGRKPSRMLNICFILMSALNEPVGGHFCRKWRRTGDSLYQDRQLSSLTGRFAGQAEFGHGCHPVVVRFIPESLRPAGK